MSRWIGEVRPKKKGGITMTTDELKALLPTEEVEIKLEGVEGLTRFVFINERERFEEVQ